MCIAILSHPTSRAHSRYDPFEQQKLQALLKSGAAVAELAAAAEKLLADQEASGNAAATTKEHLREVFQVRRAAAARLGPRAAWVVKWLPSTRRCPASSPLMPKFRRRLRPQPQYALWGNKTDLSMLVDASKLDVSASVKGAAQGAGAAGNLIVDEFEAAWAGLQAKAPGGRRLGLIARAGGARLWARLWAPAAAVA